MATCYLEQFYEDNHTDHYYRDLGDLNIVNFSNNAGHILEEFVDGFNELVLMNSCGADMEDQERRYQELEAVYNDADNYFKHLDYYPQYEHLDTYQWTIEWHGKLNHTYRKLQRLMKKIRNNLII